ncbi:MAG: HAMP domain-containing sensor histidine kinase [Opitutus sp.]
MIARLQLKTPDGVRFRTKVMVAMMLVVSGITAAVLYLAQRNAAAAFEGELRIQFQGELAALHGVQEVRHAALVERSRALVRRPRIHAALEDNALDLLYPSAKDELRDLMSPEQELSDEQAAYGLHALFYRFLDGNGTVIRPTKEQEVGSLRPEEEAQLALRSAPARPQSGYLVRNGESGTAAVVEVIAMPILSTETGEPIASIVLGFRPAAFADAQEKPAIKRGIWLAGRLHLDGLAEPELSPLAAQVQAAMARSTTQPEPVELGVSGAPHLLFYKELNPASAFPDAYEVCLYPLSDLRKRERKLRWSIIGVGAVVLLGAYGASHIVAARLSQPVDKLAVDSAENLAKREKVEAQLEATSEELQRAARFSADASHQLKTPVTVLRAGLEELLTHEKLSSEECHEISSLIHQTHRLSGVIEDLLLLSRMDAGRLKIEFQAVNLSHLIDAALDDLSAQPGAADLNVETDFSPGRQIKGEERYVSLILQNLLENARKYNRRDGIIQLRVYEEADLVYLEVKNTGKPISLEAQTHIFERFHRGAVGENVPGYGLGLNLARELARLHGGDLRLVTSDQLGTVFEVRFQSAASGAAGGATS